MREGDNLQKWPTHRLLQLQINYFAVIFSMNRRVSSIWLSDFNALYVPDFCFFSYELVGDGKPRDDDSSPRERCLLRNITNYPIYDEGK